jgi:hypothetical protein
MERFLPQMSQQVGVDSLSRLIEAVYKFEALWCDKYR